MRAAGYGEKQPRLDDDRLPIVLVVLDGLGDRPIPELGGRTPSEAASTPVLDALARRGASGWHLPFGWGRAPSSELAHWAMFGFADVAFPGRAVLEAIGAGLDVEGGVAMTHSALRTSRVDGDRVWITGRAARGDEADVAALRAELQPVIARHGVHLLPLDARGEALLSFPAHCCGDVTDSDPFFEDFHPWLRPLGTTPEGEPVARAMTSFLLDARGQLVRSSINTRRRAEGRPALDVLTTKWSGVRRRIPSFIEKTGVAGAAVTDSRLYRGLAGILEMSESRMAPLADVTADLRARLHAAGDLIDDGARFVHVHTKATDEAGHTKSPYAKRDVIEAADAGLAGLAELAERAIVVVTGDHATPSTHGVLHTGDPTPLVVAGPTVSADSVVEFGETPARMGWYGIVHAEDLLPLLFGHANRPVFLGHRATRSPTLALPDAPEPMSVAGGQGAIPVD